MSELPYQKADRRSGERLRAALDKPTPQAEDDISDAFFNPWDDLIDGCVGAYDEDLDRLAIDVLKAVRDRTTFSLLRTDRGLAAQLFMHMLSTELCDYGSSPRGLFPRSTVAPMWDELIAKWEAYAAATWPEA